MDANFFNQTPDPEPFALRYLPFAIGHLRSAIGYPGCGAVA
jgi:hypothetical protein